MMLSTPHNHTGERVYGNGVAALTPIEGAARAGYLDGCAGRGFRAEWERQEPQWQRNYEAGRQWAAAVKAIGLEPADWPEGSRVPHPLLAQLAEVRRLTGSGTRPEDAPAWERPGPTRRPVRAMVPRVRRGRIIEELTA
jgi:hypothetical protein